MIKEKHIDGMSYGNKTIYPMLQYTIPGVISIISFKTFRNGQEILLIYDEKIPLKNVEFDGTIIDELIEVLQRIKKEQKNPKIKEL